MLLYHKRESENETRTVGSLTEKCFPLALVFFIGQSKTKRGRSEALAEKRFSHALVFSFLAKSQSGVGRIGFIRWPFLTGYQDAKGFLRNEICFRRYGLGEAGQEVGCPVDIG